MIKALYFDLDNTLIHRQRSIERYAAVFVECFADRLETVSASRIARIIKKVDNGGYPIAGSAYNSIKQAVAAHLYRELRDSAEVDKSVLLAHWIEYFPKCSVPMPGANQLLELLDQQGVHLGIISNGAQASRLATASQLEKYNTVDQLLSSGEVGIKKPDPQIFQHAMMEAGFAAQQCCYVGDHPINDIQGATSAGMTAIWLQGFHPWPKELDKPQYAITSLAELPSIIFPS
ncbi:MAG: HAD family hydrolase [Pseudomonadales bacterium]|nr:HAD family hydrolase [Pseudomonadales bacterium]NRA14275.1 HAD family hydrolase [Oceanospirillaceae bacterium]